jgi:O-antigen/teichoic acid export membrane protein
MDQAGLYAAAQNLAILPGIFGQAVSAVILSELTRKRCEAQTTIFDRTAEQSLHACLCLVPVAGLVGGAAPAIAVLCFGQAFEPAGPFVSVLMVGAVAQVFIGIFMAILTAGGHTRWTMLIAGPLVPIALVGHLWSIPAWGPLGAAWTTSGALLLGASAAYLAVRHVCLIRLRFRTLVRALFFGAVGWSVGVVGPAGAAWLLVGLPCMAIMFVALYGWLEGFMNFESLSNVVRQMGRRMEEV